MPIIRQLEQLPAAARGGAVAIGNFDGVHLGHRHIVDQLLRRAEEVGGPPIVFTFDPHPVRILRPEHCPPPLTWTTRKAELLAGLGVFKIVAYPTDEALLSLSAAEFFQKIVIDALDAKAMVEGPNFYFGKNREGTTDKLRELTTAAGMSLDVVEPVEDEGELVSSSRIRALITEGQVAAATRLLDAPYRIRGMVTHGAGRGAKLGFPTANLEAIDTLVPAQGVYAGRARVENGSGQNANRPSWHAAAVNLGPNPTFGESQTKTEVHLLDHNDALYGKPMEVEFLKRLRPIERFDSQEALVEQLKKDIEQTREVVIAAKPQA
ncbi:bifunctional riboflavin kinase/FAD synthetase [Adhaeretor mobilis]|uniref:Riboflavin biosynthesis protein n=1 Tax=Adhaeretor mobilis TaxID=1930276 RepID=A0A517N090_9BACT|nr:bifunctional riboflavin kinase/FAD synthetase [Adhaeretor mobilis]QDT00524.1 Riboflavin kinase [Adhaeretor mobilis]